MHGQFEELGVVLKEPGVCRGRGAKLGARPLGALHRLEDAPIHAEQHFIGGGPEEVFLAAKIAIDGALAHAGPVGNDLNVGAAETDFRKGADRLVQDGLPFARVF